MTRTEFCTLMKLVADKTAKAELVATMLPDIAKPAPVSRVRKLPKQRTENLEKSA